MLISNGSKRSAGEICLVVQILVLVISVALPLKAKAEWGWKEVSREKCKYYINEFTSKGISDGWVYRDGICFIRYKKTDENCKLFWGEYAGMRNGRCVPVSFKYGGEPDAICKKKYGNQSEFSFYDNRCKLNRALSKGDCWKEYGPDYYPYQRKCVRKKTDPNPQIDPTLITVVPSQVPPIPDTPQPDTPRPDPPQAEPCGDDEVWDPINMECVERGGIDWGDFMR